jgi:phage terminase large subunit-like protein
VDTELDLNLNLNRELEAKLRRLPAEDLLFLKWHLMRRPNQTLPNPIPYIWFLCAGRNTGKTLTGSYSVLESARALPNRSDCRIVRVALVSETFRDVRLTMLEGATGLVTIIPDSMIINYNRSMGELKVRFTTPFYREVHFFAYSSETPELLRGPAHHIVWLDEVAKLKDSHENPIKEGTTWSNLLMGLREGPSPHIIVTGTPENSKLVNYIEKHPETVIVNMGTFDNAANVPEAQLTELRRLDPNSKVYKQEVLGLIVHDNPDAQFNLDKINENRKDFSEDSENLENLEKTLLVLGWDPSVSNNEDLDEAGIILAASVTQKVKNEENQTIQQTNAYVLEDFSGFMTPTQQSNKIVEIIFEKEVDELVFEQNQGAGFIMTQLFNAIGHYLEEIGVKNEVFKKELKVKREKIGAVRRWKVTTPLHTFIVCTVHAKQNKQTRAGTASLQYDFGRVHHPTVPLTKLEEQMITWNPMNTKNSPDRMDALVYCILNIFGFDHSLARTRRATLMAPPVLTQEGLGAEREMSKGAKIYSLDLQRDIREGVLSNDISSSRNPYFSRIQGD